MSVVARLLPGAGSRPFFERRRYVPLSMLLLAAAPAYADTVSLSFDDSQPSYTVIGNGESYTHAQGSVEPVRYTMSFDAGPVGGVRRYHSRDAAGASKGGTFHHSFDHEGGFALPGDFLWPGPRRESTDTSYGTREDDLVAACNAYADTLRGQGYGNTYIFNRDHVLSVRVSATVWGAFWVNGGFNPPPVSTSTTVNLTCREWAGAAFEPESDIAATPGVADVDYALQELYGLGGACKVQLATTVTTTHPNMELRFRYEHDDGKLSNIYTEYSGADKTVELYHEFDIPNGPGLENGQIRVVGVNPEFHSQWENYALDCVDPATEDFKLAVEPSVSMETEGVDKTMIGGLACPTRLKLKGLIRGPGGDASAAGQAAFVGTGYVSAPQDYEVSGDQTKRVVAYRDLQWDTEPAFALPGHDSSSSEPTTQTVRLGFNITGSGGNVIASVPRHDIAVVCHPPQIHPPAGNKISTQAPGSIPTAPGPLVQPPRLGTQRQTGVAPPNPRPLSAPHASTPSTAAPKRALTPAKQAPATQAPGRTARKPGVAPLRPAAREAEQDKERRERRRR